MTLCLMPSTLLAFTAKNSDGKIFYYEIDNENDKTCYVAYTDSTFGEDDARLSEEINIPEYANGYKVTGPNGNSISLPAAGIRNCYGDVLGVGSDGRYWSSTPNGSNGAWRLYFSSGSVFMDDIGRCNGQSVRLVQD